MMTKERTESAKNVPSIEDSFEKFDKYPSVTERYYKRFYFKPVSSSRPDHCILLHSNRICLVTLAPCHPIIAQGKRITKLDFQITDKLDRLENKVTGKGKKGGQYIQPDSVLCFVECEDGSKHPVHGCVNGKLIEVNESLLKDCNLAAERPFDGGYIAIILPSKKDFDYKKQNLIPEEELSVV